MKEENIEILGRKVGMTQVFMEDGKLIPVTVVEVGPCVVLQVKTTETDGYNGLQIGFRTQKESRVSKAHLGHVKKADSEPKMEVAEFRTEKSIDFKLGDVLSVDRFSAGEKVDVISTTKGKGFQGVVKRWGFRGGPASHGSMWHRRGGSYGNCQWPGEVLKGKKMPGRAGGLRRTVQNLEVIRVISDKNILLVKGTFAGANGSLVTVRKAKKSKVKKTG